METTIVIFGASGFIGTHLLKEYSKSQNVKLVAVDLLPPRVTLPSVEYHIADVRDLSGFDVSGGVDLIINLAAVHVTPGHHVHEYYQTNVLGASEVTAFARRKEVKEIIFTSSISVYGPAEETKSECSPIAPVSAYGWSKYLAERIHKTWMDETDERKLIICRPAVIFGHGEGGNFCRLAKLLQKGFFVYPGRKDTIKACFYVKDLIAAFAFAREQTERCITFNGCYTDRYTIEDIVNIFKREHFPSVRTFMMPRFVLLLAAALLRPFSRLGLGIHPDRVMKLVRSTDVIPAWLSQKGVAKKGALEAALLDWKNESGGRFN